MSCHPHLFVAGFFWWTVGMTGDQDIALRKRRSREEVRQLVVEFGGA